MTGYLKSQWFGLLVTCVGLGMFVYNFVTGSDITALLWLINAATWGIMSNVSYNEERITRLESKVEQLERELKNHDS